MSSRSGGAPEFLVAGHVTQDVVGDDLRPGGTASFAAVVAVRLGLRTAVLTSAPAGFAFPPQLDGVDIHRLPAADATVMEHRWVGRRRDQYLRSRAATLTAGDVPAALRDAAIVLLGPVVSEVDLDLLDAFPDALRGATIQGWLRRFGEGGRMEAIDASTWDAEPLLSRVSAVFLSDEDLDTEPENVKRILNRWAQCVPLLAVTGGDAGARVAVDGRWFKIAAMPAREVDGTGAGDAFAAGFLIRYHETADASVAARFATAVASFVVEAAGIDGAPTRNQVEERLQAFASVNLVPASSR